MGNSSTSGSKDASRFFVRAGLFVLLGGIVCYSLVSFVGRSGTPQTGSDLRLSIHDILSHAPQVEVLGVGNSHNVAVDFEQLDNAFPAWTGASDLFEVEYLLHAMVPRLPNLHVVLIPISYFSFRTESRFERTSTRTAYYRAIGGFPLNLGDTFLWLRAQGPDLPTDHGKGIVLAALRFLGLVAVPESEEVPETLFGQFDATTDTKVMSEALIAYTETDGVPAHFAWQRKTLEARPDIVRHTTAAIEHVIQTLQESRIRLVFYTPPYFFRYTELYDRDTVEEMHTIMADLVEKYGIEYYDYSGDPDFANDPRLFMDDDHLNKAGARLFTERVRGLLFTE